MYKKLKIILQKAGTEEKHLKLANVMPPKLNEDNKINHRRKWMEDEHGIFAIIFCDEENMFAIINLANLTLYVFFVLFLS